MNTTDTISFWQLVVNVIGIAVGISLFLVTIFTFKESIKATKISHDNYTLAEKNFKLAESAMESSTKENKERFALETKQTDAQIAALKDQVRILQEQFAISNKPYLSINEITTTTFQSATAVKIKFNIQNIGKYPIKVVQSNYFGMLGIDQHPIDKAITKAPFINNFSYLGANGSETKSISFNDSPLPDLQAIKDSGLQYYFGGKILFANPIDGTKRKFVFIIKFIVTGENSEYEYIKIDNSDI